LLGLLAGALLVRHLLLAHRVPILTLIHLTHINVHGSTAGVGGHVEDRRCLAGVIDDNIVDVVVVYDVRDVLPASPLSLNPLLLSGGWPATAHPESLAIRVPSAFQSAIILALLRHGVLGELLLAPERPLLPIPVAVDEVVVLL